MAIVGLVRGVERAVFSSRPPPARDEWDCLNPDLKNSIFQAENRSQRMMLTRTPGMTVLGVTILDRAWQADNEISEVVLNIDSKPNTKPSRYGPPEFVQDPNSLRLWNPL